MKPFPLLRFFAALLIGALVQPVATATAQDGPVLRLGWQTPWAVQGQLVMGLTETPIAERLGLELQRVGFAYGGPLNAGAISGGVDIVLTADQPALVLLSRSDEFVVIGRMMYNRTCVYVPPGSNITALGDLSGKSVSGPVGASAERVARAAIVAAGVDEATVEFGALDMAQQRALITSAGAGAESWRGVDVLYGFDPLPADFEENDLARMIHCDKVLSVVLARKDLIEAYPDKVAAFMCAFEASWLQYARDSQAMNARFREVSSLTISDSALDRSAELEENFAARTPDQIRLTFSQDDYRMFDDASAFLAERGLIPEGLDVRMHIDTGPLDARRTADGCAETLADIPFPLGDT